VASESVYEDSEEEGLFVRKDGHRLWSWGYEAGERVSPVQMEKLHADGTCTGTERRKWCVSYCSIAFGPL
jgi:hypothetical protein